jgi:hypothetical protein
VVHPVEDDDCYCDNNRMRIIASVRKKIRMGSTTRLWLRIETRDDFGKDVDSELADTAAVDIGLVVTGRFADLVTMGKECSGKSEYISTA